MQIGITNHRGSSPRGTTDRPARIARLKANGDDGTITLEVFRPQREHLLFGRGLLRRWWVDPDRRGDDRAIAVAGSRG
jgi:hypothetical protein